MNHVRSISLIALLARGDTNTDGVSNRLGPNKGVFGFRTTICSKTDQQEHAVAGPKNVTLGVPEPCHHGTSIA